MNRCTFPQPRLGAIPLLFAALFLGAPLAAQDSLAVPVEKVATANGHAIMPFSDTLFMVHARIGSFTAAQRAEAVAERIRALGRDPFFSPDSLRLDQGEGLRDIRHGEEVIISLGERDAAAAGRDLDELALEAYDAIHLALVEHRKGVRWTTLAKEILLALLVVIVLYFLIRGVDRGAQWTRKWLEDRSGTLIKGLHIRDYELFTAERSLRVVLFLNTVLKWLLIVVILYLALPVLFGIFPWTGDLAGTLFGYVTDPLSGILRALWNFLPDLITIVVIVVFFRYVMKGLAFLRDEVAREALVLPGFYPDWAAPTYHLLRLILYAFMIVVIFPYLPGSESPIFKGVSVFLGALFTFGSAGSLSNIIAGLVLTYMRSFRIGDRVKIGEVFGDVIERTMLTTRVRTIKNEIISIPNSTVIGSHTINYSSDAVGRGLILHSTVTIGYDVPWRQVHQLLIDAAKATEHVLQEPSPFVLQTSLDDYYVSYQINAFTKDVTMQAVTYSLLHQNIQDAFNKAGVEIMSPHYRALRDGNVVTIPVDDLPPDHVTPAFRVQQVAPSPPTQGS